MIMMCGAISIIIYIFFNRPIPFPVIVLLRLVHFRWSHTDLLAILLDFLLAVGFEAGFQSGVLLFLGLFGFGFHGTSKK